MIIHVNVIESATNTSAAYSLLLNTGSYAQYRSMWIFLIFNFSFIEWFIEPRFSFFTKKRGRRKTGQNKLSYYLCPIRVNIILTLLEKKKRDWLMKMCYLFDLALIFGRRKYTVFSMHHL